MRPNTKKMSVSFYSLLYVLFQVNKFRFVQNKLLLSPSRCSGKAVPAGRAPLLRSGMRTLSSGLSCEAEGLQGGSKRHLSNVAGVGHGMAGTAVKCILGHIDQRHWATVSAEKLFHPTKALAELVDMDTSLSVCVTACPPLTANISQVSETILSLPINGNNLLSKTQEKWESCCKLENQRRRDLLYCFILGKPQSGAQSRMRNRPIGNWPLLFPGLRELLISCLIQIAVQIQRQMWQQQKCLQLFQ